MFVCLFVWALRRTGTPGPYGDAHYGEGCESTYTGDNPLLFTISARGVFYLPWHRHSGTKDRQFTSPSDGRSNES